MGKRGRKERQTETETMDWMKSAMGDMPSGPHTFLSKQFQCSDEKPPDLKTDHQLMPMPGLSYLNEGFGVFFVFVFLVIALL